MVKSRSSMGLGELRNPVPAVRLALLLGLMVLFAGGGLQASAVQRQLNSRSAEPPQVDERDAERDFDAHHLRKNAKFADFIHSVKDPGNMESEAVIFHDTIEKPEAFPTSRSSLIILGTITGSKAILSRDKTALYSEFSISVENILGQKPPSSVIVGSTVVGTRLGGTVRFNSGHSKKYRVAHSSFPKIGSHYLLFLYLDPEFALDADYGIITGYELDGGIVQALDDRKVFTSHDGESVDALLGATRAQLAADQSKSR